MCCGLIQINGVNLKSIPARDAYSYALALMEILFTQDEMSSSLLFSSKRSIKPPLDRVKVEKLLGKFMLIGAYAGRIYILGN